MWIRIFAEKLWTSDGQCLPKNFSASIWQVFSLFTDRVGSSPVLALLHITPTRSLFAPCNLTGSTIELHFKMPFLHFKVFLNPIKSGSLQLSSSVVVLPKCIHFSGVRFQFRMRLFERLCLSLVTTNLESRLYSSWSRFWGKWYWALKNPFLASSIFFTATLSSPLLLSL